MPDTFRLALLQIRVEGGELGSNLARAEQAIASAAAGGARVALLPETMDLGWTDPSARLLAGPIPSGHAVRRLCAAAASHRIFVCAGLTERCNERVFNSAVLIDPAGSVISVHRKLNELVIGHACYDQGDRLGVVETELGTIGLMICADGFARDLAIGRALGYMGASLILSPCAYAMPADHDNAAAPFGELWRASYGPVAREFSLWIASASNVGWITAGPWAGRKCIGCSMIVNPLGEDFQAPYGENAEILHYADIKPIPRPARGTGWKAVWSDGGAVPVIAPRRTIKPPRYSG
jgi:predicted amidohydrolase